MSALPGDYAGAERLVKDTEIMGSMAQEDAAPPEWGEREKPGTLPWAQYQIWRLRDAGGPTELVNPSREDPVGALLSGGETPMVALLDALADERFTRAPADPGLSPLPDLLRIGDLAFDLLGDRVGRDLLTSRGVDRLHALAAQERSAVIEEAGRRLRAGKNQ